MIVFDIVAIHTTLEFDGFFIFFRALAESEKFFPSELCSVDESLSCESL